MKRSFIQLAACLAALAFFATGTAYAQNNKGGGTTGTTTGPVVIPGGTFAGSYVISAPGSYLLGGNRSTDGSVHVIEIKAPNVTLDLNGFTLSQANLTETAGIYAANACNIEIRNGSILHAKYGIYAAADETTGAEGSGVRVSNVRVVDSTGGVASYATATHVDHCEMVRCGAGIYLLGVGSTAADCTIQSVAGIDSIGVLLNAACRLTRTSIHEAKTGILATAGIVTDCGVTSCQVGVQANDQTTLRNVDILGNTTGIVSNGTGNVVIGCRLALNTTNFAGSYTNGGGNFIQ